MAKLAWDQPDQRRYEFGVDHGVVYPDKNPGVVWNGLVGVEEESIGGDNESYYYDGIKYLDFVVPRVYSSTISAYTVPSQFRAMEGEKPVIPGFYLTRQKRSRFGLSYRTFIGGTEGYKIHIVYNALASPSKRSHETMTDGAEVAVLEWKINAVPPITGKYRPSPHYILDSTKMSADSLATLEEILYGNENFPARLPTPPELENIATHFEPQIIVAQSITGLSQLTPGVGDVYHTEKPGLNRALPQTRLVQSSVLGLYRLE